MFALQGVQPFSKVKLMVETDIIRYDELEHEMSHRKEAWILKKTV